MTQFSHLEPETAVAVRTLLTAGYTILQTHRQPRHIELYCQREDVLGASINYLIAITASNEFTLDELDDIRRSSTSQCQIPIFIARESGHGWISWQDFTGALGGAVPAWQALSDSYEMALITAAANILPQGEQGEAWLIFEDLVAAGLEFIFGRRVRRLGGRKRGKPLSDMQAQIPQGDIVVVDAKAAGDGFDATWPSLRPLVEYVDRQRKRQIGQLELISALVVSSSFHQDEVRLQEVGKQFYGATRIELTFIEANKLTQIIETMRNNFDIRNAIRWSYLLTGGSFSLKAFDDEVSAARSERIARGEQ